MTGEVNKTIIQPCLSIKVLNSKKYIPKLRFLNIFEVNYKVNSFLSINDSIAILKKYNTVFYIFLSSYIITFPTNIYKVLVDKPKSHFKQTIFIYFVIPQINQFFLDFSFNNCLVKHTFVPLPYNLYIYIMNFKFIFLH